MKNTLLVLITLILLIGCKETIIQPTEKTTIIYDEQTSLDAAVSYTQFLANNIKYEISLKKYFSVSDWLVVNANKYIGQILGYGVILDLGLDNIEGIRIRFMFNYNKTQRNISVNVFTGQTWIGEPL